MLYKVLEPEEFINSKEAEREIIDIMENNNAHLKLVSLKKHAEIEPHMSHADACVYVTEGEIEITFLHDEECSCMACSCTIEEDESKDSRKYKIKKGQMILFEKNITHSVKALKDSMFLLIKI